MGPDWSKFRGTRTLVRGGLNCVGLCTCLVLSLVCIQVSLTSYETGVEKETRSYRLLARAKLPSCRPSFPVTRYICQPRYQNLGL